MSVRTKLNIYVKYVHAKWSVEAYNDDDDDERRLESSSTSPRASQRLISWHLFLVQGGLPTQNGVCSCVES